jgi:hypothetical protein
MAARETPRLDFPGDCPDIRATAIHTKTEHDATGLCAGRRKLTGLS